MKKNLQFVFLLAFSTFPAWSQTCSVAKFQTQAEIDNFSSSYPGCTVLNGNVEIISSFITNLDGLHDVTGITGSLRINHNPNLTSLAGLSSLQQIDGALYIQDNDKLLTLAGLELVRSVRVISISSNEKLTSLAALSGLSRIRSSLIVSGNPALTSLYGLHNVTRIFGGLSIGSNGKLEDLTGLKKLRQIDQLNVSNNAILKNLKGLESLEILGGPFIISGNNALTSISELAQLKGTSSTYFPNFTPITNNPLLSDCAIKIVCASIALVQATISGNAAGCATTEEVRTSQLCTPQTLVRINTGGPAFTTATQKLFTQDQYYAGIDRTSSIASGDILNTTNYVLYRSGRSSPSFSYNIPVVND